MDKKLTLSLDAAVVKKAKTYAKEQGTSLSRMIENYLALLTNSDSVEGPEEEISPLVANLVGVVSLDQTELDLKADYSDYLSNKYE